jgi:hypothetical protein
MGTHAITLMSDHLVAEVQLQQEQAFLFHQLVLHEVLQPPYDELLEETKLLKNK